MSEWLYMEDEDKSAAIAHGIREEDKALAAWGGLPVYIKTVAARALARKATHAVEEVTHLRPWDNNDSGKTVKTRTVTYEIPKLPQTPEEAVKSIPEGFGISLEAKYKELVREHIDRVAGVVKAIQLDKVMKGEMERSKEQGAARKADEIERLTHQNPFGWDANSQSSRDWAIAEYTRRGMDRFR